MKTKILKEKKVDKNIDNLSGYPDYPPEEDIYNKDKKEREINPEDISAKKLYSGENNTLENDLGYEDSVNDLDIPGSELDDDMENIGSEDEENNFYSLGEDYYDQQGDNNEQ